MDPHPFHTIHCFPIKRVQIDLSLFTTQRCVHAQRLADSKLCCTLAIKEAGSYISAVLTAVVSALGRKEPTYTHYIQYMLFSPVPTSPHFFAQRKCHRYIFSCCYCAVQEAQKAAEVRPDRTAAPSRLSSAFLPPPFQSHPQIKLLSPISQPNRMLPTMPTQNSFSKHHTRI